MPRGAGQDRQLEPVICGYMEAQVYRRLSFAARVASLPFVIPAYAGIHLAVPALFPTFYVFLHGKQPGPTPREVATWVVQGVPACLDARGSGHDG
jgi:hypothetical protein